jgi:hypothetical protein
MPKTRLVLLVVLMLAFLCLTVAVGATRRGPALTATIVRMVSDAEAIELSIQVSNRTAYPYLPLPVRLEIATGAGWESYRDAPIFSNVSKVAGHAGNTLSCMIKRFKSGERLRLVIEGRRPRIGLDSFLFRLKRRLFCGDRVLSLNPLDSTPVFYGDTFALSDEFKAP